LDLFLQAGRGYSSNRISEGDWQSGHSVLVEVELVNVLTEHLLQLLDREQVIIAVVVFIVRLAGILSLEASALCVLVLVVLVLVVLVVLAVIPYLGDR
jgi:hypothetical protein